MDSFNYNRVIGKYTSDKKGPLLLVTAGVHGNEPSGVEALRRIFLELEKTKPPINGSFIGIAANVAALDQNIRFIDEDLNRTWTSKSLSKTENLSHEEQEMHAIINVIENIQFGNLTNRYFLDCHSTSSKSLPYISVQDVGKNNAWAHRFPLYIVKGFSDIVNGSIDKYFSERGMTGFTFEAGQHTEKNTIKYQEALIWLAMETANKIELEKLNCFPECARAFEKNPKIEQRTFEIIYRHGITAKDNFSMEPGFSNFQKIVPNELLAEQNGKKIRSKWNAHIFMPLYQTQGNDGFFVVKEIVKKK